MKTLKITKVPPSKMKQSFYVGQHRFNTQKQAQLYIQQRPIVQILKKQFIALNKQLKKGSKFDVHMTYGDKVIDTIKIEISSELDFDGNQIYINSYFNKCSKVKNLKLSNVDLQICFQDRIYQAMQHDLQYNIDNFKSILKEEKKKVSELNKKIHKLSNNSIDILINEVAR